MLRASKLKKIRVRFQDKVIYVYIRVKNLTTGGQIRFDSSRIEEFETFNFSFIGDIKFLTLPKSISTKNDLSGVKVDKNECEFSFNF